MPRFDNDTLRVDVPVGFLLPEAREITVSVDRPTDGPLAIRLRLVPAQVAALTGTDPRPAGAVSAIRPQRTARLRTAADSAYADGEYGGGD